MGEFVSRSTSNFGEVTNFKLLRFINNRFYSAFSLFFGGQRVGDSADRKAFFRISTFERVVGV